MFITTHNEILSDYIIFSLFCQYCFIWKPMFFCPAFIRRLHCKARIAPLNHGGDSYFIKLCDHGRCSRACATHRVNGVSCRHMALETVATSNSAPVALLVSPSLSSAARCAYHASFLFNSATILSIALESHAVILTPAASNCAITSFFFSAPISEPSTAFSARCTRSCTSARIACLRAAKTVARMAHIPASTSHAKDFNAIKRSNPSVPADGLLIICDV